MNQSTFLINSNFKFLNHTLYIFLSNVNLKQILYLVTHSSSRVAWRDYVAVADVSQGTVLSADGKI